MVFRRVLYGNLIHMYGIIIISIYVVECRSMYMLVTIHTKSPYMYRHHHTIMAPHNHMKIFQNRTSIIKNWTSYWKPICGKRLYAYIFLKLKTICVVTYRYFKQQTARVWLPCSKNHACLSYRKMKSIPVREILKTLHDRKLWPLSVKAG